MLTVVRHSPDPGPAATPLTTLRALGALAFPWFGNQATALSPVAVIVTVLLMATAILAFVLTWALQVQVRRNRQLHAQLQAQRALQQATLEALPFPIWLQGLDGRRMAANRDALALLERNEDLADAVGSAWFAAQRDRVLDGGTSKQDLDIVAPQSDARAVRRWIRALCDERGQARGFASTLMDLGEFRDAEQAARQTEARLGDMAQRLPVVVVMLRIGHEGMAQVSFVTGDALALFNMEARDLRDAEGGLRMEALRERVHPDDLPALLPLLLPRDADVATRTLDFRAFGQHGLRWIHATFATRMMDDGSIGAMGYFIDTTEQNLRNEALRIARDVAERASKAKADFLATMSHEIRTPMNGVIGMLELLGRTPVNAEQRELLHSVEESAGALLQILNDILDFSKLEAGDLRLDPAPFDPRQWLDSTVSSMVVAAQAKGLALQLAVDAAVAGQWRGDAQRLRQILINLLNNAIKFTDRGGISVALSLLGDNGAQQHVALSVTDTGIGIAADKQQTLFQPFTQAEAWTSRRYGGTGLGLAICQQLAQLMDGQIQLRSTEGTGTTITVQLRLPVTTRAVDAPPALHGRHAIVRLASSSTADALEQHLRAAGMTVENIHASAPWRDGMAASLLFIDAGDTHSADRVHARVVTVADEQPEGDATWLAAQPLTWRAVIDASLRALELESPAQRRAGAPDDIAALRGRVLVVEDHPVSQRLIARQLALLGLSSEVVDNGQDALDMLAEGGYALLLTDCNMPRMSGYELARQWRQREADAGTPRHLPIIAMTANALGSETARAKEAGMDDVLSKPLQLATLGHKLAQWLGELALPAATAEASREDLHQLLAQESARDLRELQQHLERQDRPAAVRTMHRLLGALPLLGNEALVREAEHIYEALHGSEASHALPAVTEFAGRLARHLADRA
jgi:signal transduction histidine kinase/DNA-binding response OmpR family regulator